MDVHLGMHLCWECTCVGNAHCAQCAVFELGGKTWRLSEIKLSGLESMQAVRSADSSGKTWRLLEIRLSGLESLQGGSSSVMHLS